MLEPGTKAPAFSLPDQNGVTVSLDDFAGRWLVLWWFVKASTSG
jgi:thioredoxin-dependent peroxiredoxin